MYQDDIDHILMHLHRLKARVAVHMADAYPGSADDITCRFFLDELRGVYEKTRQFRILAGNLSLNGF